MSLKAVMDYGYGLKRDILKLRNYTITEKRVSIIDLSAPCREIWALA